MNGKPFELYFPEIDLGSPSEPSLYDKWLDSSHYVYVVTIYDKDFDEDKFYSYSTAKKAGMLNEHNNMIQKSVSFYSALMEASSFYTNVDGEKYERGSGSKELNNLTEWYRFYNLKNYFDIYFLKFGMRCMPEIDYKSVLFFENSDWIGHILSIADRFELSLNVQKDTC